MDKTLEIEQKQINNNSEITDKPVSVSVSELLPQVKFAAQPITTKVTIPIIENLAFDKGKIIGTDLMVSCISKTKLKCRLLIPAKKFIAILSVLDKSDQVSLRRDNVSGATIILVNSIEKFKIETEDFKEFPVTPVIKDENGRYKFLKEDILKIYDALPYTSNDELRPAMMGIYIGKDIAATNGHYLYWNEILNNGDNSFEPFIIPKKVAMFSKKWEEVDYVGNKHNGIFKNGDFRIVFRKIDEKYPDYVNVIPSNDVLNKSFTIDKKVLVRQLKQALLCANTSTKQVKISLNPEKDKLSFQSEDLDFNHSYNDSIKVLNVQGEGLFDIGFNASLFLQVIDKIKEEKIKVRMCEPNQPAIINNGILLMPVMLDKG